MRFVAFIAGSCCALVAASASPLASPLASPKLASEARASEGGKLASEARASEGGTLASGVRAGVVGPDTPESLLSSLYARHRPQHNVTLDVCDHAGLAPFLDRTLINLLRKDCDCARKAGEPCALDWDPFYDAQDFAEHVPAPRIRRLTSSPKVTLEVTITNFGEHVLIYELAGTQDGWRIANISSSASKWSLRAVLAGKRPK